MAIDLEKKETTDTELASPQVVNSSSPVTPTEITSEYLKANTKIHGWLTFFLFAVSFGGLISAIIPIATFDLSEYSGSVPLAMSDVVVGIMLLCLAVYTLITFVKRKPNAVFTAKTYVVVVFITNLISLISGIVGGADVADARMMSRIVRSLIWAVIWFLYLTYSQQVQEVIPKSFRKTFTGNYVVIVAFFVVPISLVGLGVHNIISQEDEVTENLNNLRFKLQYNERTDGKILFSIPDDYQCEEKNIDGLILYTLKPYDRTKSITLCSDFDGDDSKNNFQDYWTSWKDEELDNYNATVKIDELRSINDCKYFYKVTKYTIDDNDYFWRFAMLFDKDSRKVCVISCYDTEYDGYLQDFLSCIKFLNK